MELNGYSRALMGFDFADASALLAARRKFADYLAENGVDMDQAESDAHELNHSWEFATYAFCPTGEGGGVDNTCSPINKGDTVDVQGEERGVKNSLGQTIHSTKEGVQNFYGWFGNSKILDRDGKPLVLYHGTQSDKFDVFDPNKIGTVMGKKPKDLGFWFVDSKSVAQEFTTINPDRKRGHIMDIYLKMDKPYTWDKKKELQGAAVRNAIKGKYDGVIFPDVWDGMGEQHTQYLVFSPIQIKAVSNKGKFDPKNPKINFSFDPIQNLGKSFMLRHLPIWRGLMDTRPGSPHLKIFGKYAELKERRSYDCQWCGLHRYHLPGQHDQCAHSPTGECQPVESGKDVTGITTVKDRAFRGQPKALRNSVGKQETGAIGEALALRLTGAKKMNGKWNNFPIDLIKGNTVYEVKAGLVSNGADAQKWRLTIGEPGPKEKAWLRKASPAAKARWNDRKADMIVERKRKVVADLERRLGRKVRLKTLTFIIDPDRKIADMHEFDGVHPVIRWRSGQAASGYRRTVRYG